MNIKGFIPFPKSINPKVDVIVRLEFELAYFEASFQSLCHGNFQLFNFQFILYSIGIVNNGK